MGLITLGTPHHGTPSAYIGAALTGLFAPSIWQLMPMSPFIRRLKEGPFPESVHLASICSRDDRVVPWPAGLLEPNGSDHLVNVEVRGVAHHEFVTRKSVYAAARAEVETAYARALLRGPSPLAEALASGESAA